jgi:PTH1 family peptidyl-tRNA hydrolase
MKLLVGLGNPGAKYARNRHNVGFLAVDRIADAHSAGPWRKKFQGFVAEVTIGGERVLLLKPDTYMNESGRSVGEAVRFYRIALGDIVVFYDDIDLAPGKLKVKVGGGNGGHNGLRSISALVGNEYVRVRIGVGHPGHKDLVAAYVLSDFAKAEQAWVAPMLDAIAGATGRLANGDTERFMTDVALALQADDTSPAGRSPGPGRGTTVQDKARTGASRDVAGPEAASTSPRAHHPAGERSGKRASALAENLRKWMEGRKRD